METIKVDFVPVKLWTGKCLGIGVFKEDKNKETEKDIENVKDTFEKNNENNTDKENSKETRKSYSPKKLLTIQNTGDDTLNLFLCRINKARCLARFSQGD